jgi:hypothetical protein
VTAVVVVEGVVIAVLALLVVGLLRSHAEILRRLHDLGAGLDPDAGRAQPATVADPQPGRDFQVMPQVPSPPDREGFTAAADLSGAGVADDALTVRVTGVQHDTVLAFLSSGCLTCQRFWDAFRKPKKLGLRPDVRLVVVTKGSGEESPATIAKLAPPGIPLVMSSAAWTDYGVPGSPYFVFVHGLSGRVRGEGTGPDWDQVSSLLEQATGEVAHADQLAANRIRKPSSDADRESRIDTELLAAGVPPGDPSLYTPPTPVEDEADQHDHDHLHDHDPRPRTP